MFNKGIFVIIVNPYSIIVIFSLSVDSFADCQTLLSVVGLRQFLVPFIKPLLKTFGDSMRHEVFRYSLGSIPYVCHVDLSCRWLIIASIKTESPRLVKGFLRKSLFSFYVITEQAMKLTTIARHNTCTMEEYVLY